MRLSILFGLFLLLSLTANSQSTYSDRDESDFKVNKKSDKRPSMVNKKSDKPSSREFKIDDKVWFPYGVQFYPNMTDLRYFEGPETTAYERANYNGRFRVRPGSSGFIAYITTYSTCDGKTENAYHICIEKPGLIDGWCDKINMFLARRR